MAVEELTLHSQAIRVAGELQSSGFLYSGDADDANSSSAIRFALPIDFAGDETINAATLNLYAQTATGSSSEFHKSRIRVLAATDQDLPTTIAGVSGAAGGSEEKTIGEGTHSPVLDYTVSTTAGWVAVDIAAMLTDAAAAGRLSGGWVVILIQPVSVDEAVYLRGDGLTQTNPPTIDLDYSEPSPPPPDEIAQPADAQVKCEVSLPATFIDHWDATLDDAQVRVHATEPQVNVVGQPSHAQVRVHATEPQVTAHWIVTPADAQVAIVATEPQVSYDWVAAPANAQVLTQATLPRVYGPQRSRGLFPSDLFSTDLFES